MSENRKTAFTLLFMFAIFILLTADILFTAKIVRAPDIINEFYWGIREWRTRSFAELATFNLSDGLWNHLVNSGFTTEGGEQPYQFLVHHRLIFRFIPLPTSVAWFMVLHLFFGACGTYLYCRAIGVSRFGAMLAGIVFGLTTEHISLINAGHAQKIATISFAPMAFYLYEVAVQKKRLVWFLSTAVLLAFQFFNYHWQIAFYTCLSIAFYGIGRSLAEVWKEGGSREQKRLVIRLLGFNLALIIFFLSTVSISLFPLSSWSKDTNRGAQSGANQGKGGLDREEAMSWSMPPEELATYLIPGAFGYSRQEGGENPTNIPAYYWGRMHFTQTGGYLGLLPWLLAPLPLIFRRDRYTWLAVGGIILTLFFSMGKYTLFYNLLYDYFPGINRFRVPKMMLFMTVFCVGILAARGFDLLTDQSMRENRTFRRYLLWVAALPLAVLLLLGVLKAGETRWIEALMPMIAEPTRYESGAQLIGARWSNILYETAIAAGFAALYAALLLIWHKKRFSVAILSTLLLALFLVDIGRVNAKYLFTVEMPHKSRGEDTPVISFLKKDPNNYRVMPISGDPQQYSSAGLPTFFYSMAVQQTRWQDILDNLSFTSSIPDMLNLKYLIVDSSQYAAEKAQFGDKYSPVFLSPDGREVVIVNNRVLPKAWLVPSAIVMADRQQRLATLLHPAFDPQSVALVESSPELSLQPPGNGSSPGVAEVSSYKAGRIVVNTRQTQNGLLVLGEKYYKGWRAYADGKEREIFPVNHILRGIYLPSGNHQVEFIFDPLPYRVGKWLSLSSMVFFAVFCLFEWRRSRKDHKSVQG